MKEVKNDPVLRFRSFEKAIESESILKPEVDEVIQ